MGRQSAAPHRVGTVHDRRRLLPALLSAALVLISLTVSQSTAQAAPSEWATDLSGTAKLAALPDGTVAALVAGTGITHLSVSGAIGWQVPDPGVDQGPVADERGNVYWTSDCLTNSCQSTLVSVTESKGSRWPAPTTLPFVASVPLADGPNGLIYVAGIDPGSASYRLAGVSKATGKIAFNVPVDGFTSDHPTLSAISGGVAAVTPASVTFYGTTGTVKRRWPLLPGGAATGAGTPAGVVWALSGPCGTTGQAHLARYTLTSASAPVPVTTGDCAAGQTDVEALPDGGAAVAVGPDGTPGTGETVYNTGGSRRWSASPALPAGASLVGVGFRLRFLVDAAGTVAAPYQFSFPCQSNTDRCWGVQTDFFKASDGTSAASPALLQVQDPSPQSYGNTLTGFSITSPRVYLSLGHENGGQLSATTADSPVVARNVAGLGYAWPQKAIWNLSTPIPPCPTAEFVGVRGSGETDLDAAGYGTTVDAVRKAVLAKVAGSRADFIDYPAIPVEWWKPSYGGNYKASVATGESTLNSFLNGFRARCGATPVVLIGYSQGAQVAGDVYQAESASVQARIAALAMFGDPRFNPAQPAVDVGSYDSTKHGSYTLDGGTVRRFVSTQFSTVHSYCLKYDPVCNYSTVNAAKCAGYCVHLHYVDFGYTSEAATWILSRLGH